MRSSKSVEVRGSWSVLGFLCKHQCVESDACSYWKLVEGVQQWGGVGELGKVENKIILDLLQRTNCIQGKTCQ